jgi:hypothetical protein
VRVALFAVALLAVGCGHLTKSRPTPAGQWAVEAALGGPLARVGDRVLPLPLSTLGATYGLSNADVGAHAHLTTLAFGVAGVDVGGTYLPLEQDGARPALGVTGRLYAFTDLKAFRPYLEVTPAVSWLFAERFLSYVSASVLGQTGAAPQLSVAAGEEVLLGSQKGVSLQLEWRWYEPNHDTRFEAVDWIAIGGHGGWGVLLGLRVRFGGET